MEQQVEQQLIDSINLTMNEEELDIDQLLSRVEAVLPLLEHNQLLHFKTVLGVGHPSKSSLVTEELIEDIMLEIIESGFDYDQLVIRFKILLHVCEVEQLVVVQKMFA